MDKNAEGRTRDHRPMLAKAVIVGGGILLLAIALLFFVIGSGVSSIFDSMAYGRMVEANERQSLIPSVVLAAEADAREAAAISDARAARADSIAAGQISRENTWGWLAIAFVALVLILAMLVAREVILYRQELRKKIAKRPDVQTNGKLTIITPPDDKPLLAYNDYPAIAAPQVQNGLTLQVADPAVVHPIAHANAALAAVQYAIETGQRPVFLERGD